MFKVWKLGSNAWDTKREHIEEVGCFKYLGSQVAADGGYERDVVHNE